MRDVEVEAIVTEAHFKRCRGTLHTGKIQVAIAADVVLRKLAAGQRELQLACNFRQQCAGHFQAGIQISRRDDGELGQIQTAQLAEKTKAAAAIQRQLSVPAEHGLAARQAHAGQFHPVAVPFKFTVDIQRAVAQLHHRALIGARTVKLDVALQMRACQASIQHGGIKPVYFQLRAQLALFRLPGRHSGDLTAIRQTRIQLQQLPT